MSRTAPPTANLSMAAVPVFQTNQASSDFAPQSVGKVERDSMAEFWYRFTPLGQSGDNSTKLCMPGDSIIVTLYDQNKNEVHEQEKLECNQDGS